MLYNLIDQNVYRLNKIKGKNKREMVSSVETSIECRSVKQQWHPHVGNFEDLKSKTSPNITYMS